MKSSDSTEMDRLLRRYARQSGKTLRATGDAGGEATSAASSGVHLDADEMNAYAEGALPEAARSRYFSHLADCDTCRKLVTELTLAAAVSNEGKARVASLEAAPSKSWREWLGAIFSPPVLRYGVPAMALFVVIIVAIVATRSQREASSVAQNKEGSNYSAPAITADNSALGNTTATGTAENHANSNIAPFADQQTQTQPGVVAATPEAKPAPMEADRPVVSQETVQKSTAAQAGDTTVIAREFGEADKRAQGDVAAAPPPTQNPVLAAPAAQPENRDKREEQRKSKAAGKDDSDEITVDGRAAGGVVAKKAEVNEDRSNAERNAPTAATTSRSPRSEARRRLPMGSKTGPADVYTEKERSAETRSIGGRHFQRQGSAWVDTAYNSSRPTTNIRRGSEQYRALVADEPGLRSIAEQLGGEVIVLWKSRAYRFY